MPFSTAPLTQDRWADLETLFGETGACYGCWCIKHREPQKRRAALLGEKARALFARRVADGPPPGVIAYRDDAPAGWLQIGPRAHVPEWNRPGRVMSPTLEAPAEDEDVWAATCFFVGRGHRGFGVTSVLLQGGIDFARSSGARVIDACPFDAAKSKSSPALSAGSSAVFARAGFVDVARRREGRPLMRMTLAGR